MRCIIHEVSRNCDSIATNFEENTALFSQLEIIRLIQSIPGVFFLQASCHTSLLIDTALRYTFYALRKQPNH